jgi:hypothetical protein
MYVYNVVKKWAKDKWNANVVRLTNNQTLPLGFTHERKCVHMIFKAMSIKSEANYYSCRWLTKEAYH